MDYALSGEISKKIIDVIFTEGRNLHFEETSHALMVAAGVLCMNYALQYDGSVGGNQMGLMEELLMSCEKHMKDVGDVSREQVREKQ